MKLKYDISPVISPELAVFPGDCSFSSEELLGWKTKDHIKLSSFRTTAHIGAHADASDHYHVDGISSDQLELGPYMGPVLVLDLSSRFERVYKEHRDLLVSDKPSGKPKFISDNKVWKSEFEIKLDHFASQAAEGGVFDLFVKEHSSGRILFKTKSYDPYMWTDFFCYFAPDVVKFLARHNISLIGIDTPSVDWSGSKDLLAHQELYKSHMRVLEGLDLSKVPEGSYNLIALPLKLKNVEASPVRAILI